MEIRDLDFANDASAMLSTMVDQFSQDFISTNDRRYDIVCVCVCDKGAASVPVCSFSNWFQYRQID